MASNAVVSFGGSKTDSVTPVQTVVTAILRAYIRCAYRVRGWGALPQGCEPTLLVANHQHDLDSLVLPAEFFSKGARPLYSVATRRDFEPGFIATQYPAFARWTRRSDWSALFTRLGMLPIENQLHARPLTSLAFSVLRAHGNLLLADVFRSEALEGVPSASRLQDLWAEPAFRQASTGKVSLRHLREPFRSEVLRETRTQLAEDYARIESTLRDGATVFLTPEGGYPSDGRMRPFRSSLERLRTKARIVLVPVSYDPFLAEPLSMLYRILAPASAGIDIEEALCAARPITVSQLLAHNFERAGRMRFSTKQMQCAVRETLEELDTAAFVDPQLRRDCDGLVERALRALKSLRILGYSRPHWHLLPNRKLPRFPHVSDIVAHQAACFAQTANALAHRRKGVEG